MRRTRLRSSPVPIPYHHGSTRIREKRRPSKRSAPCLLVVLLRSASGCVPDQARGQYGTNVARGFASRAACLRRRSLPFAAALGEMGHLLRPIKQRMVDEAMPDMAATILSPVCPSSPTVCTRRTPDFALRVIFQRSPRAGRCFPWRMAPATEVARPLHPRCPRAASGLSRSWAAFAALMLGRRNRQATDAALNKAGYRSNAISFSKEVNVTLPRGKFRRVRGGV